MSRTLWQQGYSDVAVVKRASTSFYECKCRFCGEPFTGQPQRLKDHLLHTTAFKGMGIKACNHRLASIDPDLEEERQNLLDKLRKEASAKKPASEPQQTGASGASGSGSSAGGPLSSWLVQGSTPLNEQANDALAAWIAQVGAWISEWEVDRRWMLLCALGSLLLSSSRSASPSPSPQSGLAFHQVEHKAFDEFIAAAIRAGSSWRKLSRRTLTRSISKLADRLRKQLEQCRGGYAMASYSVTSDGWSDVNRRALINVVGLCVSMLKTWCILAAVWQHFGSSMAAFWQQFGSSLASVCTVRIANAILPPPILYT